MIASAPHNPLIQFPMGTPPIIRHMAVAVHGQKKIERWSHLNFWSLHAYHYRARLRIGDAWHAIEPGTVTLLPPNIDLEYQFFGPSRHVYAHFDPPPDKKCLRAFQVVYHLGTDFLRFESDMREAIGWFPHETERTLARVWDLLWRLTAKTQQPAGERAAVHPVISQALTLVETNLAFSLSVETLAEELDISRAHLVRLFRQHLKMSPLQYILSRRVERSMHLLQHTTLPIKAVAREVGIRDLQQFNKLLRHRLGRSPRSLRR